MKPETIYLLTLLTFTLLIQTISATCSSCPVGVKCDASCNSEGSCDNGWYNLGGSSLSCSPCPKGKLRAAYHFLQDSSVQIKHLQFHVLLINPSAIQEKAYVKHALLVGLVHLELLQRPVLMVIMLLQVLECALLVLKATDVQAKSLLQQLVQLDFLPQARKCNIGCN